MRMVGKVEVSTFQIGNYKEVVWQLFPGISFEYYYCDGTFEFPVLPKSFVVRKGICINYCYQGGFEMKKPTGEFYYRGAKQATLSLSTSGWMHSCIPQEVYEAASVSIYFDKLSEWMRTFFSHQAISFEEWIERFQLQKGFFYLKFSEEFERRFATLYGYMEENNQAMLTSEVLALIIYVSTIGVENEETWDFIPQKKYRLVKKICSKMEEISNSSDSIQDLVAQEGMKYTDFQKIFRELYFMSPSEYRKKHRMNEAAFMLKNTEESIIEIAYRCGYDNPSKFSATFRKVVGINPSSYRRQHQIKR